MILRQGQVGFFGHQLIKTNVAPYDAFPPGGGQGKGGYTEQILREDREIEEIITILVSKRLI